MSFRKIQPDFGAIALSLQILLHEGVFQMKKETNQKRFDILNELGKEVEKRLEKKQWDDQPQPIMKAMIEAAPIDGGKLFRSVTRHGRVGESMSTQAVADIVKAYAKLAGLNPDEFSGHSLRAGFVTSAAEKGRSTERIMDHTGHQSAAMVRVYTRRVDVFTDHAGEGLL